MRGAILSQHNFRRDFLFVVVGSASWGTVGVANQFLFAHSTANALSLACLRLTIATPFFFLAAWVSLRRRRFDIRRRDLIMMVLMGCMIGLSHALYVAAIAASGVTVSTLIAICAAPVIVALLSTVFARERPTSMTLVALGAALVGTIMLVVQRSSAGSDSVSFAGAGLAFLAACLYAGFVFCGRLLTGHYHPVQISLVAFASGALLLLICSLSTRLVRTYPVSGWLVLLYLGCVPTALGYGLFQVGMRSLSATLASIVTMCEPLTAALLAWIMLGEQLGPLGLLGAALLLGAMAIIVLAPGLYLDTSPSAVPVGEEGGAAPTG